MKTKSTPREQQFSYTAARARADELLHILSPGCHRLEIAGSVRRERETVHDIDLVGWVKYHDIQTTDLFGDPATILGDPDELNDRLRCCTELAEPISGVVKIARFFYRDMPVELYLAERDGSNFEALWQMRTGSAAFNAWLAGRARNLGLHYKAGFGIYASDQPGGLRVDDGTERGIFEALRLPWRKPIERTF